MTKGQRIIGSLLIVVAGLLALNLSLDVSGEPQSPPWPVEVELRVDPITEMQRQQASDSIMYELRDISAALRAQPAASSAGYQELQVTVQVLWEKLIETRGDLRDTRWDLRELQDDVAKLSFGVHLLELKHVWDDVPAAERARREKRWDEMFDQLRAAEKKTEAQDDG